MKKFILLIAFLAIIIVLYGQSSQNYIPSVPPSPQAEAIKRYGEYSVNFQTGVPNISIPIYEINHHGYKLPISLNYFPTPLKPGYNYDVYGHGWGLSINSSISRNINFAPDETRDFQIETPVQGGLPFVLNYEPFGENGTFNNLYVYNYGCDDFNAVLPDGSSFGFKIWKDGYGNYLNATSNGRKVMINPIYSGSLSGFEIIDENGVKYTFSLGDYLDAITGNPYSSYYVSWQLTQIDLPNSNEPIVFNYYGRIRGHSQGAEPEITFMGGSWGFEESVNNDPPMFHYSYNYDIYNMLQLFSIEYGDHSVGFNYAENIYSGVKTHNYVTSISTSDKQIELKMYPPQYPLINGLPVMFLDSVKIKDYANVTPPLIYKCVNQTVGSGFNGSTDHWGNLIYEMGSLPNFRFYVYQPHFVGSFIQDVDGQTALLRVSEGNRNPAGDHGLLSELHYPTGGYTKFEWERHKYQPHTDEDGYYHEDNHENGPVEASGFRIHAIKNYTSQDTLANQKSYVYGNPDGPLYSQGCGEAVVDPNILSYMEIKYTADGPLNIEKIMAVGDFSYLWDVAIYSGYAMSWQSTLNARNFRRLLNGRPQVLYSEVTENYVDGEGAWAGKTVYKYDIYDYDSQNNKWVFFEHPQYYENSMLDYVDQSYRYNKLKEKSDYKKIGTDQYELLKKEIYTWNYYNETFPSGETYIFKQYNESFRTQYWYTNNYGGWNPFFGFRTKPVLMAFPMLNEKKTIAYSSGDSITTVENYQYNYSQMVSKATYSSNGDTIYNFYKHPSDGTPPDTVVISMIDKNIISPVIADSTINYNPNLNQPLVSGHKIKYGSFLIGSRSYYLPQKDYDLDNRSSGNPYVQRNQILSYTANGNPLEVVSKDGIHTCYIWGYGDSYMLASIVDASYDSGNIVKGSNSFSQSNINSIISASDNPSTTEQSLINSLNNIRSALPNSIVTTYTYKPLTGVTSVTDPNGVISRYEYDGLGRLKTVIDKDDNVTGQYKYHYVVEDPHTPPPPPPAPSSTLWVSPYWMNYNPFGGSDTIFIRSTTPWSVTVNDPWISVSSTSGSGDGYIILTCEENQTADRTGSITITNTADVCTTDIEQFCALYSITASSSSRLVSPYECQYCGIPSLVQFYYSIPSTDLYQNDYVSLSTNMDPEPVGIHIFYQNEYDWLDFSWDAENRQLTFWATRVPEQTNYAVVLIASEDLNLERHFAVRIVNE